MPSRRPAARPGQGPGPGRAPARRRVPVPPPTPRSRTGLTVRAAWLGLVLCLLVVSAAVPLREYLSQRQEIGRLQQAQAEQRDRIDALRERARALQDPVTVEREARERFGMVRPGETLYVLQRPEPEPDAAPVEGAAPPASSTAPWWSQLWSSVQAADGSARP